MRRTFLIYVAYAGGDRVTQLGLRLAAAEHHYDFVATPHEATAEAATLPTSDMRRVRRR